MPCWREIWLCLLGNYNMFSRSNSKLLSVQHFRMSKIKWQFLKWLSIEIYGCFRGGGGGGTHMLRHTGMCCPNGLLFHQKSLDMGPILQQKKKIPRRWSHFSKIAKKKICQISRFWGRKALRNGSRFAEILKKKISRFLREKNPQIWVGVLDLRLHTPVKKWFEYPLGLFLLFFTNWR